MIESIFDYVVNEIKTNQFAAGGFVIGALTAIWSIVRGWPIYIYNRISRLIIYSVTIEESDNLYRAVDRWTTLKYNNKYRKFELFYHYKSNDRSYKFGDTEEVSEEYKCSSLNDFFFVWQNFLPVLVSKDREKLEGARDKENAFMSRMVLKTIFTKKPLFNLVDQASKNYIQSIKENEGISIYMPCYGEWSKTKNIQIKPVEHIIIDNKEELLTDIQGFLDNKDWYESKYLQYKRNYLLYGPPGTGKTSLVHSIAKHYDRDLYFVNIASVEDSNFISLCNSIPEGSILLLDDVDIAIPTKRKKDNKKDLTGVRLNTLLHILDGTLSLNDVMIFMTTNYRDRLDAALLRKGRCDVSLLIDYPSTRCIEQYASTFYETDIRIEGEYHIPMVDVQDMCITSKDPEKFIESLKRYNIEEGRYKELYEEDTNAPQPSQRSTKAGLLNLARTKLRETRHL